MIKLDFSKLKQRRIHIFLLFLVFFIYGNSINNEYALDDNIVVHGNEKVNSGLIGLSKIFTSHHAIDKNQNYGYRPLVLLSFAIEKQFFGHLPENQTIEDKKQDDKLTQANISHFVNVIIYAFTSILLFSFLLLLFKDYTLLFPLLITILFVVHPLHTEPVANIKSRDELLMFLGILLALTSYLKFSLTTKYKYLIYGGLFFLLALLSKKTAILIIGILPVILYFSKARLKYILLSVGSILCCAILVVGIKQGLLSNPPVRELKFYENPLFFTGDFMDRITVGLYCSWFYLKMLIFPKDMSYYYGYDQIPMANWTFYQVWLALIFYIPLLGFGFWKLLQRNVLGLGIILWLGVMFAYLNILTPVVGIVAIRFAYIFSLGFCIVVGYLLLKVFKIKLTKGDTQVVLPYGFIITVLVVMIAYSSRVIVRNPNWHDYLTLYYNDVEVVPNSAKVNALLSNNLYHLATQNSLQLKKAQYIEDIITHYSRAVEIDSSYKSSLSNLGSAYIEMKGDNQMGIIYCKKALALDNNYLEANLSLAIAYDRLNQPDSSSYYYYRVIEIDPIDGRPYSRLNDLLSKYNMVEDGIIRLDKLAQSSENPKYIYMNIANLYSLEGTNIDQIIAYFVKAFDVDGTDAVLCEHIANLYQRIGSQEKASYYQSILKILTK
ncbi:MAG: hypothetical protein P1U56_26515 [Saprospiraceae bacterium]|nr:hypothetical protein [Saprospiraceae bacterium]